MIDADPYPWPFDGNVAAERLALVIAGGQPAWIERSIGAAQVAAIIEALAAALRAAGATVVHVRHGAPDGPGGRSARALPPTPDTTAWQLATPVKPGDVVADAAGVDGYFGGPLDRELRARHITHLVLAGYGAEAAVDSTLRSANDRGYECLILRDACAPFDAATGVRALASVTMSGGIFGAVASSEQLLVALPRRSLQEAL